jgi:hypothetical protein
VICAVVLLALLSAWVATGGAGTLSRLRIQVSLAAVPMRAFTPKAASAIGTATTFLTIRNLSDTPDELIADRCPQPDRPLCRPDHPHRPRRSPDRSRRPGHPGGRHSHPEPLRKNDVVLQDPNPFETTSTVALILTFRHAGTITIEAAVTSPDTP